MTDRNHGGCVNRNGLTVSVEVFPGNGMAERAASD
jgi:hypothetical protein